MKLALLITEKFIGKHSKWFLLTLTIIAISLLLQWKFTIFRPQNTLLEGMVGTYQEHNLPLEVTNLLSEGLVKVSDFDQMEPNLASSWDINNDATIFKFYLRDNIYWIDGSPIQASDLSFNIPDVEITTPDERTIQFKLKEPYSPLPSLLTKPIFKKGTLTGTGPYKLDRVEKSRIFITKLTLTPKENNLPKLLIRFYPNERVAIAGFNLGEVQTLMGMSNPDAVEKSHQVKNKQVGDLTKIVTILYSLEDPILGNRSLRQALSFAAPRIEGEDIANNPYPTNSWAHDKDSKKYLSNIEEAQAALERAKSSLSEEQLKSDLTITTTPNLERVAQIVVEEWKKIGFNVNIRVESGVPQHFQMLLITQSIPRDPDQYVLWHSSQIKTNLTKYSSARVDKDLEDGRKTVKEEDRKVSYYDFQKTLLEDAPATFLYFPKYNLIYLKKVEGLLDKVLPLQIRS
ncbi:MAG: ABC transporter substrate-binding protein [Candidatus Daviesbacteria bacterium]|nr:ABC transporter substrate-binding protein [Candidatus Daviesbacteria bacterium]